MKALFFHANLFGFKVEGPSERIGETEPEKVETNGDLLIEECFVALFHVEENDNERQIHRLCKDIERIAKKVGASRLMVAAFGHLSDSYAAPNIAIQISEQVVKTCREWPDFKVFTSPFGHNKTLVLHSKDHSGAIKHRSY